MPVDTLPLATPVVELCPIDCTICCCHDVVCVCEDDRTWSEFDVDRDVSDDRRDVLRERVWEQ